MQQKTKIVLTAMAAGMLGCILCTGAVAGEVPNYAAVTQQRLENPEPGNWLLYRRTYNGHGLQPAQPDQHRRT